MSQRILLYGLPPEISREIRDVLITSHIVPDIEDDTCSCHVAWQNVDLVFCPADRISLLNLLAATAPERPRLRVIATSRLPEVAEWLDSVEAGATDYCAAPFEPAQIRWLLDAHLAAHKTIAA